VQHWRVPLRTLGEFLLVFENYSFPPREAELAAEAVMPPAAAAVAVAVLRELLITP